MRPFEWSSPTLSLGLASSDVSPRDVERPRTLGAVPAEGLDFGLTFGSLHGGGSDPCVHLSSRDYWRASWTPNGPGTLHIFRRGRSIGARAFGPGAAWLLERAVGVSSLLDRPELFEPQDSRLRRLRSRVQGLRLGRSATVLDTLLPTILGQRVKVVEARRSWRRLIRAYGASAPGPAPLALPPEPQRVVDAPSWVFAEHGVDRSRSRTFVTACRHAGRLLQADPVELLRLLDCLPGIGPWTQSHVRQKHLGDADAVVVGDHNLPHAVGRFFSGRPRSSDEEMLNWLEPFRGQRARAVRWIGSSGVRRQRFGPKTPLRLTP